MKRRAFICGGMAAILASRRAPAFCVAMRNGMMRPSAPPTPPLPYDYAVQYIETDGVASYINTGILLTEANLNNLGIDIDFQLVSYGSIVNAQGGSVFGFRISSSGASGLRYALNLNTNANRMNFYLTNPSTGLSTGPALNLNRNTVSISDKMIFNGIDYSYTSTPSTYGDGHRGFCIGKDGDTDAASYQERYYANARFFSCVIRDNGVIVFNGIPVVANGVAGMYDSVSGTVKTNAAATGTITAGPRV